MTPKGLRDLYVRVVLYLQTRKAILSEATRHPDSAWVCQQTKWFTDQTRTRETKLKLADLRQWQERAMRIVVDEPRHGLGLDGTVGVIIADVERIRSV